MADARPLASRRDAARRRRHEFWADRIGYRCPQNPIDLSHVEVID
jgi:hypothetical protein